MKKLGLIGSSLKHSFSKSYFKKKFLDLNIKNFRYDLYEISKIEKVINILKDKSIVGLNVTIPYKQDIIKYLHEIKGDAQNIKTVNTIKIINGYCIGYNTDILGFKNSLKEYIGSKKINAIVLGNGGASQAIQFALKSINIKYVIVSRNFNKKIISYNELNNDVLNEYKLIINTTSLGMYPYNNTYPKIPYNLLTNKHYLYDLVYNPTKTLFLQKGEKMGSKIINGFEMLKKQADLSWEIWQNNFF
ncbi:MAG: shikimate dehydrogenase [Bacteroides sp.]|nr:MAG: shikimate dehydrogenase [Bacteroides sp.]